jgi:hypothetical protein
MQSASGLAAAGASLVLLHLESDGFACFAVHGASFLPVLFVVVVMTVSVPMLAMHEQMHQRACQNNQLRQRTQYMRPVIDDQQQDAGAEYAPDGPVYAFPEGCFFVRGYGCVHADLHRFTKGAYGGAAAH